MNNITILNCFSTGQTGSGNPAAVVLNFEGTDNDRLLLAQKTKMPVTVFISDINAKEPALKFFYPDMQMPLCLHGTLGAAKVILSNTNQSQLICHTDAGKKLTISKSEAGYYYVAVSEQAVSNTEIKKETICELLNIDDAHSIFNHLPCRIASVGSPKLLVPLTSLKQLLELEPNFYLIKKWSIENKINGLYVYTPETHLNSSNFHARGFNPKTGHNEDAATGVAAAALSLALKGNITVEQGYSINRPCCIVVTYIDADNILVGGQVLANSLFT